jgi:hypothetical protein
MGPESSSEYFDVNGTIESTNTTRYLNVGSDSTSYKTLTLAETANTTAWGLEGDTIITTTGSTWGRREFFLLLGSCLFCVITLTVCHLQSSISWLAN